MGKGVWEVARDGGGGRGGAGDQRGEAFRNRLVLPCVRCAHLALPIFSTQGCKASTWTVLTTRRPSSWPAKQCPARSLFSFYILIHFLTGSLLTQNKHVLPSLILAKEAFRDSYFRSACCIRIHLAHIAILPCIVSGFSHGSSTARTGAVLRAHLPLHKLYPRSRGFECVCNRRGCCRNLLWRS